MNKTLVLAVLGLALCQAERASAAGINVSPVQVHLSKDESKAQVQVRNESDEPARFQLGVSAWGEDPQKGMQLTPTQDIVFFPALLSLKPGEQRAVRVGVLPAQFGLVEKTYRLFVEELPPAAKPGQRSQVRVLTRVGIPIFLGPTRKLEAIALELRLEGAAAVAEAKNGGNVHFRINSVDLKAFDEKGAVVLEKQQQGWYVLANGKKPFRFELPEGTCRKARRLIAVMHLEDDRTYSQALDTPSGACGK